jgi:hypothetical protein
MDAAGLEALAVAAVELYQGVDITDLSQRETEALERAARLHEAEAGEPGIPVPPVIACKCCVDNECECKGRLVGAVARNGEIVVPG